MQRQPERKKKGSGGAEPREGPTLMFIVGPPAVGKMTVGQEIARRTGYRLFHNHLSIEPVLRIFAFGTKSFNESDLRLAEKPSKRDVESSRRTLLEHESQHRFSSRGEHDGRKDWMRIDTTHRSPDDVAEGVIRHFGLDRAGGSDAPGSDRTKPGISEP